MTLRKAGHKCFKFIPNRRKAAGINQYKIGYFGSSVDASTLRDAIPLK